RPVAPRTRAGTTELLLEARVEPGVPHEVDEPGAVEDELAAALQEPERRGLVLAHAEQPAERDAAPLLRAETARDDDRRRADRLRQRLDDERVEPPDRRADEIHDQEDLARAEHPAPEVPAARVPERVPPQAIA